MLVLAEFEFEAGRYARIIYEALLPELEEDYQRTKTALRLENDKLILNVEATDMVSMRAALNGWLRLIKITHEIITLKKLY